MSLSIVKRTRRSLVKVLAVAALLGTAMTTAAQAQDGEKFKVGVITFLSGGAAESFGVPAWRHDDRAHCCR